MTTFNTGNPIGSTDPRDLYDNAQNLDEAVNTQADRWTDRLGNERVSLRAAVDPSGFAQSALNDANRAEAAADAATVNADVYDDTASGLAGTSNGEQFQVVEGEEVVRYRNESGTAVEVARYPTPAGVRSVFLPATDTLPARAAANIRSYSDSLQGGELRPELTDYSTVVGGTGAVLRVPAGSLVSTRRAVSLGNQVSQGTGQDGLVFRAYAVVSRSAGDAVDVEFGVAWYQNDYSPSSTPETVVQVNEAIGTVSTGCAFTFGRDHSAAEVLAPEDARYAVPFVRFPLEVGQPLLIDLNVEGVTPLASGEFLSPDMRVRGRGALQQHNYTHSLAPGFSRYNRPKIPPPEIFTGTASNSIGPLMDFPTPTTLALRDMVDLGILQQDPSTVIMVHAVFNRPGGTPALDVEFGVAWYRSNGVPSDTPTTTVVLAEAISTQTQFHKFTMGRPGSGAEVESPEDARFCIPFLRTETDGGTLRVAYIDAYDITDLTHYNPAQAPRTPLRGYFEPLSLTNSLAGGDVENRPPVSGYDVFEGSTGPSLQFSAPVIVARRQMVDMGTPDVTPAWVTKVQMGVSRAGTSAGSNGVPVDVDFGVAWYKADRSPSDTPKTVVRQELQIGVSVIYHSFTLGRPGAQADVIAPEDAYFAIPYVEITSEIGLPRIAFLDAYDVTDVTYLEPGSGGDAVTGGEQTSDVITRFDLPLRISEAEAEAMSPADRALREWYYIDGALVHRDDLPAFAPATPSATIDFPSGEAWTHTVDAGNSTITINARQTNVSGISRRLFAVQVDGVQGMTPTVHVTRADDWNSPYTLTRHRLAWSHDLDGDDWQPFDLEVYDSDNNEWRFQNTYPFGFGRLFLANTPFYSWGRVLRKDMEWARNRHTRPTESSLGGYVIGTASARTAPYYDKPVPATEHTAFRVGSGDKIVALFSGVHPDEKPGFYQLEGCMALITSDTELGQRLRETFTFYVYPAVNRQGLYAGAVRWEAETGEDTNRIWGVDAITNDLRAIYETAWATDLGDKDVVAAFDFHSTAATNPATSNGAQLWYRHDLETPAETALLEHMEGYREFDRVESSSSATVSAYMRSQFTPPITMTSEFTHARTDGIDDWRAWGRNLLRGLYALREQL